MQRYRIPAGLAPDAAEPARAGGPRSSSRFAGWLDRQALAELVERSKRMAETIRARNEWIESRRRQLWARMDAE